MPADPRLLPAFEHPHVQIVYNILCDTDLIPPPSEHWEGFYARHIVAALDQQRAEALVIAKELRHEMGCASIGCPCGNDSCAVKSGKPCDCSRGLLIEKLGGKE